MKATTTAAPRRRTPTAQALARRQSVPACRRNGRSACARCRSPKPAIFAPFEPERQGGGWTRTPAAERAAPERRSVEVGAARAAQHRDQRCARAISGLRGAPRPRRSSVEPGRPVGRAACREILAGQKVLPDLKELTPCRAAGHRGGRKRDRSLTSASPPSAGTGHNREALVAPRQGSSRAHVVAGQVVDAREVVSRWSIRSHRGTWPSTQPGPGRHGSAAATWRSATSSGAARRKRPQFCANRPCR